MARSFVLGERFERFIDSQVRAGRYDDASEVVREALALMEDQARLRELQLSGEQVAELREMAEAGWRSGVSNEDGEMFLDRLEARYTAIKGGRHS